MQFCVFCVYYWCSVVSLKLVGLSDKLRCHYASNQVLVKLLTSELQHPTTFLTQTDSLTGRPPPRSKRPGPQRWLKRPLTSFFFMDIFCICTAKCDTIYAFEVKLSESVCHYLTVACFDIWYRVYYSNWDPKFPVHGNPSQNSITKVSHNLKHTNQTKMYHCLVVGVHSCPFSDQIFLGL